MEQLIPLLNLFVTVAAFLIGAVGVVWKIAQIKEEIIVKISTLEESQKVKNAEIERLQMEVDKIEEMVISVAAKLNNFIDRGSGALDN